MYLVSRLEVSLRIARMSTALMALVSLLCLASCQIHSAPPTESPAGAVIFVPGFKGSVLADENDKTIWINTFQGLLGGTSLALHREGLGLPDSPELHPAEVLHNVTVIPFVYHFNAYGTFTDALWEKLPPGVVLREFPYDWRGSIAEASAQLFDYVQALHSEGVRKVILVGHSMGGTLVAYFLRYGAQEPAAAHETWSGARAVDAAITIAAPFKGALTIFCDLQFGTKTAFNKTLLSVPSIGSFSSPYELLPEGDVIKPDLSCAAGASLSNLQVWKDCGLGLMKETVPPLIRINREQFLGAQLQRSALVRSLLFAPPSMPAPEGLRLTNILGTEKPTEVSISLKSALETGCSEEAVYGEGDGTVSTESAKLPEAYSIPRSVKEIHLPGSHESILSRPELLDAIVAAVRN